ncbi:MAG: ELM1/GtrOC1 family putative glycosyltransferase [Candidatus Omnitrophica bacterium]|nr:ELM1/GtrOC1 family putative glycosyltransferase [Candidatus Omnitrophota bacterium]MDD5429117.1 ELM1/GtrOC1 family putative glycosyltransferase [Candidatus Omnitrophota bacterium]
MYKLANTIRYFLLKLPLSFSLFLGYLLGFLFYFNFHRRRIAFKNVKMAFPAKTSREALRIVRRSSYNLGLSIVECLIAPRIYQNITIKGEENIEDNGGIFVGIHSGNWEVVISAFSQRHKIAVFANSQKNKSLDGFLNELRKQGEIRVCLTIKELINCLKDNYLVGVVIDHGAEKDALMVEFFSHLVPTPKGAVYLAKKFNKPIYTNFSFRTKRFSHCSLIGKPIYPEGKEESQILRQLNSIYEKYLTDNPWEYFWYYKRFKHKRDRDVIVLNDKRPGHFKQALSLVKFLSTKGYELRVKIIEVNYRNRFSRILADILAFLSPQSLLFSSRMLSWLMDKKTFDQLDRMHADIVVSAGSFMAPVNRLVSSYAGAKSAVVLRPNVCLRKFDLVVIPEHDRVYAPNVVNVKGALFYPEGTEEKGAKCRDYFNLSSHKKTALFIGGPLGDKKEFLRKLKDFIPSFKKFLQRENCKLLLSTSRRTPVEAEDYLEKEFSGFFDTEALVIANRNNQDFVFEGFISLSQYVFVSSESISMISEAASLNKACVCVSFVSEDDKRKVFLKSLEEEITFLDEPYDIKSIEPKDSSIFEHNLKVLEKPLNRLF